jgi:hypothetical protein
MQPVLSALRPDVVAAPFVFSDSAPRSTLLGRHNGRRRPSSRIRDDRVQRDGAWSPEGAHRRALGLKDHRMRGRRTRPVRDGLHTEEELVEIFACRRPSGALLEEKASACTQVRGRVPLYLL